VRTKRQFRLPRILGYWPKTGLILLESIPGKPQISELLQASIAGTEEAASQRAALRAALHDCACVAGALHQVDIKFSETRTFQAELDELQALMPPVQQFSLALDMQLQHTMRRLQHYAATTAALPICFSHGDYTYTQLIFDERSCGLVDFDTVCQAEPALDLGQFLAYMRLAARKAEFGICEAGGESIALDLDALGAHFIDTYIEVAGYGAAYAAQLRARVAAYEVISLMRITLHSWQKMKSSRLEVATALLEERTAALRS
jgi:aminoglycoside phosphotransferase (APT) family kinase protein